MKTYITVSPAYGRDYKSRAAVQADWDAGKDFTIESIEFGPGRKINKADADRAGLTVMVRYQQMTKVFEVKQTVTHEHTEVRRYSDGDSIAVTKVPGPRSACKDCGCEGSR